MQLYEIKAELVEIVQEMGDIARNEELSEKEKEQQISVLSLKYFALDGVKEEKALNLVRAYKNAMSMENAIAEEIKSFTVRKTSFKNKAESIKNFLSTILSPGEKLEDATAKISWRKSEQVWFDEMRIHDLPKSAIKVIESVNKTELKNWLKANGDTSFARIETNQNIQLK